MAIHIRNAEADMLVRKFAAMEGTEITEAIVIAVKEAMARRLASEDPQDTARRLLAKHGLSPSAQTARPLPKEVWAELEGDL